MNVCKHSSFITRHSIDCEVAILRNAGWPWKEVCEVMATECNFYPWCKANFRYITFKCKSNDQRKMRSIWLGVGLESRLRLPWLELGLELGLTGVYPWKLHSIWLGIGFESKPRLSRFELLGLGLGLGLTLSPTILVNFKRFLLIFNNQ